ncbi:hypothetical protein IscW_ISCW007386, partial [Ixodes scapularis]
KPRRKERRDQGGSNPSHTAGNSTTTIIATAIAAAANSDNVAVPTAGADSGLTRHRNDYSGRGSRDPTAVWPAAAAIVTEPTPRALR